MNILNIAEITSNLLLDRADESGDDDEPWKGKRAPTFADIGIDFDSVVEPKRTVAKDDEKRDLLGIPREEDGIEPTPESEVSDEDRAINRTLDDLIGGGDYSCKKCGGATDIMASGNGWCCDCRTVTQFHEMPASRGERRGMCRPPKTGEGIVCPACGGTSFRAGRRGYRWICNHCFKEMDHVDSPEGTVRRTPKVEEEGDSTKPETPDDGSESPE